MKLYLVRHGIATDKVGGAITSDAKRPLTDEGKAETRQVAGGLKRLGVSPDVIFTSPLVRAQQTAEILLDVLGAAHGLKLTDALAPAGTASDVFKAIKEFERAGSIFLVGHEPDMGRLAATILWAGPEVDIQFKKAGICCIDISSVPPAAPGTLEWFIPPKLAMLMAAPNGARA